MPIPKGKKLYSKAAYNVKNLYSKILILEGNGEARFTYEPHFTNGLLDYLH